MTNPWIEAQNQPVGWEGALMTTYVKPNYSVQDSNAAGKSLARILEMDDDDFKRAVADGTVGKAFDVVENFRASHAFPLNSFYMTLRRRASSVHTQANTVQRLKRLKSIAFKLADSSDMKLSQMQDIGGCRAIMPTVQHVYMLREKYKTDPISHHFTGEKDYIDAPKSTGYRGVHLKFRFTGRGQSVAWNNLKIEIQLRTLLQHKWATAVEAIGTFTDQPLKSSQGKQEWLRFFCLMASIYATKEKCKTIPGTPETLDHLCEEVRALDAKHRIQETFAQYRQVIPSIVGSKNAAKYYLVTLDPVAQKVSIESYDKDESRRANRAYTEAETVSRDDPKNVVLVSAESISALRRAYPNYFLDTHSFLKDVSEITGKKVDNGEAAAS